MSLSNFFHKTAAAAVVGAMALAASAGLHAAHASRLVALVIGNAAPGTDIQPRVHGLGENLFAYGGSETQDPRIFAGHNLTRDDLLAHLSAFESTSNEGDDVVTVVAYIGPVAHSEKGTTYIVPADWNGEDERGLVALHSTLQMLKTKGRNYVMLDALPGAENITWKTTAVKPGLGKLANYGASDRLAIAYAEVPLSALSSFPLSDAFTRKLSLERIKFGDLPELVQKEAQFEIGRTTTLRQVGALGGSTELVRLKDNEIERRRERCLSARNEASNKATGTMIGGIRSDGEPIMRATGDLQASRRDFIEWFCPGAAPQTAKLHNKAVPNQPGAQPRVGRLPDAAVPNPAPRANPTPIRPSGNGSGSGNSGRSWAGNAAPVPN